MKRKMPRNNNKNNKGNSENIERKLLEKDEQSEYAIVTKKLGSGRFLVKLNLQNKEIMARVCGKFRKGSMKKNNMVDIGSIVLVGMREFQENNVDIIYVYNDREVRNLKKEEKIIFDIENDNGENNLKIEEDTFVFEDI